MDLSCIPYEIKQIIISYLPIYKLITGNQIQIFDEYIMDYINTQLLKDMYIAGRLYNSIYQNIIFDKLEEIASYIADEFIKETNKIGGPIINQIINNQMEPIISLKIVFKFTTIGKYYHGSTDNINYSLSSYGVYNNSCTWFYNQTICCFDYSKENIQNEIWRIIIKNMDFSDTTVDIKSMELIKTNINNTCIEQLLIKFI
jgi:hypothetical protein